MPKRINDNTMRTDKVRFSYLHAHRPTPKKDSTGAIVIEDGQQVMEYSIAVIFPKSGKENLAMLNECMKAAARKKFGERVPASWKAGLRDGDTDEAALLDPLDESKGRKPELVGCYWINCKSRSKPRVIGREKDELTGGFRELGEHEVKSGDWGYVQLHAYGFDVGTNKGVAFGFAGLQKIEDGEALGGNAFDESAFDDELNEEF